ncbi:putative pheophorbide a oxygenase [Helianthus annuus]|uniref:Pheophorbide a oxygenase n=1 Tax=Helianthus annuus TaxID=4232 RepID=A0A251RLE2_HELAN|nr:protein TIC 55, chloroplastic [Helianthus annuus]KAF5753645.1 putative pheophorbide a oxygenase [Helianthus annuus]KAJ0431555.1 putative pheophorbide a oxygenase [Helianthus annuus]KAJ0445990.1 putative pheophorbide a oxygenase [Helianthus annuus]KAJ0638709.1 putative pheophorbide a oxygenase [Helianthus annuus]KAJ0811434.1 putative pheophorbide a oxygenase [Helianthus annuus]
MAVLLHHPLLFHTTKTPSLHTHTHKPTLFRTTRTLLNCAAAVAAPQQQIPSSSDGTEDVLVEEQIGRVYPVGYDWTEEWYPLYLTKDVPDDAPLGLTVFDKQVVLYRDGNGDLQCYEDRCPHRLAKLSEGQIVDGRLECLYHGWQFEGNEGKCVKIPQLPANAKIPRSACTKTYEIKDSQGVVWIWMSHKTPPNPSKIPWFENFARPGFKDISTIHELPYDHSILLENLMDPAHVPISHDRTDWSAKREDAQPLLFKVTERTERGFAGFWGREADKTPQNFLRFEAPCNLQNNREIVDKDGVTNYFSGLFLCRPTGQGKSMLIVRFGSTKRSPLAKFFPEWYFHQNAGKVFEQDMGFLSSQNEILYKEKVPTKDLYLNLRSSDTWVAEYRKWMDKVGHGMPYHFGHSTISLPVEPAVVEHAPAGFVASIAASSPAKGGIGIKYAPNLANRYFRHVVHCKDCRNVVKAFEAWKNRLSVVAALSLTFAILFNARQWKAVFLLAAALSGGGAYVCSTAVAMNTTNFIRTHRRL